MRKNPIQNYFLRGTKTLSFATFALLIFVFDISAQSMFRKIADFDGDGKADFAVTRRVNNIIVWYVWQSAEGFRVFQQLGITANDIPAPGDYDGDGKTDFATYRTTFAFVFPPTNPTQHQHTFTILQSRDNSFITKSLTSFVPPGINNDRMMPQDYDGDGKTDPAVWFNDVTSITSGSFEVLQSSTNTLRVTQIPAGHTGIRIGDMDGDGTAERASYSFPSHIVTWLNLANNNTRTLQFGAPNDIYLPADFDGDRIGDLTVWRRSVGDWYWLRSSDGIFQGAHWGMNGDIPVPGDYDGDGKTDLAIYRSGIYYIYGSLSGIRGFAWGLPTDTAIRYWEF